MTNTSQKIASHIQILSPQLANQIAAGEVVERPASVVKELIENSIDANADSIHIEIEQGGHKRILIRDSGDGIEKDQLELALSRHATSKIQDIADLEHISSMGFRGEALASISSVSRLTLTSKPPAQDAAWQAYAEGLDMAVQLNPAAHPSGTSIEVLDLFFNTPARRKFLRAPKTEFQHIEQIVRRIALAHPAVAFLLKHNGKIVHKWPAGTLETRVKAVCGQSFLQHCTALDYRHQDVQLSGWCSMIGQSWQSNEQQYIFVNNRMIKDKLALHAIRQAYEGMLAQGAYPAYVLFLTLPAEQMDINVHPAKHEVRFHQARQVHDLIFQGISQAVLAAQKSLEYSAQQFRDASHDKEGVSEASEGAQNAQQNQQHISSLATQRQAEPSHDYIRPLQNESKAGVDHDSRAQAHSAKMQSSTAKPWQSTSGRDIAKSGKAYQALMQSKKVESKHPPFVMGEQHIIFQQSQSLTLLSLASIFVYQFKKALKNSQVVQPLLMPVSVHKAAIKRQDMIKLLGEIGCVIEHAHSKFILKQVPSFMRAFPWASLFVRLLEDARPCASQEHCLSYLAEQYVRISPINEQVVSHALSDFDQQELEQLLNKYGKVLSALQLAQLLPASPAASQAISQQDENDA